MGPADRSPESRQTSKPSVLPCNPMEPTTENAIAARRPNPALARNAIDLATKGRWADALQINRQILDLDPSDCGAWNRMGKALIQLGRYPGARNAFAETLRLDPSNGIARKNLEKLEGLTEEDPEIPVVTEVSLQQFIEDTGKSAVTRLTCLGDPSIIKRLVSGQPIELRMEEGKLFIDTASGDYVGQVEAKLATRLAELVRGGNRYEGHITSARENVVNVMLRETLVSPTQAGKRSFPSRSADGFRPYMKSGVGLHDSAKPRTWHKEYDDSDEDILDDPEPEGIRIVDGQKDSLDVEEEAEEGHEDTEEEEE